MKKINRVYIKYTPHAVVVALVALAILAFLYRGRIAEIDLDGDVILKAVVFLAFSTLVALGLRDGTQDDEADM